MSIHPGQSLRHIVVINSVRVNILFSMSGGIGGTSGYCYFNFVLTLHLHSGFLSLHREYFRPYLYTGGRDEVLSLPCVFPNSVDLAFRFVLDKIWRRRIESIPHDSPLFFFSFLHLLRSILWLYPRYEFRI